jgi:hypothetical protein
MLDGIYYNDVQFFRFYKDGTFLDCLVKGRGDKKQVASWLKKENSIAGVLRGSYKSAGKTISFSTPGHFGDGRMIDFTGKISGSKEIIFDSLNHNNGKRLTNERFVKL